MNEQDLKNLSALVRAGARALANQEPDNSKAAVILHTGEQLIEKVSTFEQGCKDCEPAKAE